jgi:hypothetical protein
VTGGLKGTALNALLGECNELPLNYRREKLQIKYLLKIHNNFNNSAYSILTDKNYFQLGIKDRPHSKEVLNKFLQETGIALIDKERIFKTCPWQNLGDNVDLSLLNDYVPKSDIDLVSNYIDNFLNFTNYSINNILLCDGSVNKEGKVGAAINSSSLPNPILFKLPDFLSVYFSEAYAILQALLYATNHNQVNVCIISDSAKVLRDVKHCDFENSPHPSLLFQICQLITEHSSSKITLKWMPGHYNNLLIQAIDASAKLATSLTQTNSIIYTKYEATLAVENWVWKRWEKDWISNQTCKYQRIFTSCRNDVSKVNLQRRHEVMVSRLRLQQSKLNAGLFKLGLHPNGLCDTCGTAQDNEHYVMQCLTTQKLREELHQSLKGTINWSFQDILKNPKACEIITKFIITNNLDF